MEALIAQLPGFGFSGIIAAIIILAAIRMAPWVTTKLFPALMRDRAAAADRAVEREDRVLKAFENNTGAITNNTGAISRLDNTMGVLHQSVTINHGQLLDFLADIEAKIDTSLLYSVRISEKVGAPVDLASPVSRRSRRASTAPSLVTATGAAISTEVSNG